MSSFRVTDETLLRHTAAEKIRDKRLQDSKTKQDLLVSQITSRSPNSIPNTESSGSQLIESLENDGDLLTVLQNVLGQQDEGGPNTLEDGASNARGNDGMGGEGDGNQDIGDDNVATATSVDAIVGSSETVAPSDPIFSSSSKGKGKAHHKPNINVDADTMCVHESNLNVLY